MLRGFVLTVSLMLVVPFAVAAQAGGDQNKGPFKDFAELTEGAEAQEGYFDTYVKADKLYMAIPADRLGEDFVMIFEIAQGIGAARLFGGTMLDFFEGHLVALERHGDMVYLLEKSAHYRAEPETPAAAAVDISYSASVLASAKIESIREDSAVVIDVYDWMVSDLSNIGQRVRLAVARQPGQPGNANFDKSRSYLEYVKNFPENTRVRAKLTFKTNRPAFRRTVPDQRYLPVSIHYTLAQLPEEPMEPRLGDERMGYFMTVHKNFSREDTTFFVRYVNRWRLEPGERDGDLWRPKEPIVYYIDRNVPERFRQGMIAGVEGWNKAFEAAGWRDAIRAELLPEDADPEDIRYATLRWNVSDESGYGAIGPSVVDPRTGEILDADILFEANMFLGLRSTWRRLVNPTAMLEALFDPGAEELERIDSGAELAIFAAQASADAALLRTYLAANGEAPSNGATMDEFIDQFTKWVTMHEVGHSLGLQHNFGSSKDTPLDKLYDPAWAETNGITSSVMDYHALNLAPDGQTTGYYYSPEVGSYDEWIIAYGYTPDPDRARELARQAGEPGHAFGGSWEAFGPGALDPTTNVFDLGADPLAWGQQRTGIVDGLFPQLAEHVLSDNASYSNLTSAYGMLLGQYVSALAPAIKYIGGQYTYNVHVGDVEGLGPFENVPSAKQREALRFIVETAFAEDAFQVPRDVLQKLAPNRWNHWGMSRSFDGRLDYPFYEQSLGIQTSLMNQLTHPFRLSRIRDAELKFGADNVVTIPQLFSSLTEAVWSEAWTAPGRNIAPQRRDLQRAYIDRMTEIVVRPSDRMPADARSVARVRLRDLHERISRRLTPPFNFDEYTYAHLSEMIERIERALEAGLQVQLEN